MLGTWFSCELTAGSTSGSAFEQLGLKHFATLAMKRDLTIAVNVWLAGIPRDSGPIAVVVGFAPFVEGDARIAKYAFLDSVGELAALRAVGIVELHRDCSLIYWSADCQESRS